MPLCHHSVPEQHIQSEVCGINFFFACLKSREVCLQDEKVDVISY